MPSMENVDSPAIEYAKRLAQVEAELAGVRAVMDRLVHLRLALFTVALLWAWGAWRIHPLMLLSLVVPAGLFTGLVVVHERRARHEKRLLVLQQYYQEGIARIEDRWSGSGSTGVEFLDEGHPYAADLDLFGEGSLFQLLCRARTRIGAATLARWLLGPSSASGIVERQEAIRALTSRLDLREDLALEGVRMAADVAPEHLSEWVRGVPLLASPRFQRFSALLAGIGALSLVPLFLLGLLWPAILVLCVNLVVLARVGKQLKSLGASLEQPRRELAVLARVVRRLERESFDSPVLRQLQQRFGHGGLPASEAIARLDRLGALYEMQFNQLFAPLAVLLLWGVHVGYRIERWRAQWAAQVPDWLEAVGQLEALCSLAGFAYERDDVHYPEIEPDRLAFEAEQLRHPLLPKRIAVANDLRLDKTQPLLIVSGSNMSGKSTLMRAVGINTVLAMTGAPVCAGRLQLCPLMPGATMRVHDSIQSGVSRFYAEIKRLKELLDLSKGEAPLLFLVDEILHGTNSHDRRIGAEALLRKFIENGAIGIVSTHDLSITELEASGGVPILNAHFEDTVGETGPVFDYTLRPGVVQRSNALALMRAVGLDV